MEEMKQTILKFIDRINAHDVDGIMALVSKDYEFVNSSGDHFHDLKFLRDTWRAQFENHPDFKIRVQHVICDPDGERVGVLWFGPSTDDPAMAWIYDITVDEDRRRQGWGRAIMRSFEDEARARGFARAGLNVYGDNHVARRLYESLGYAETARQLHKELPDA